MKKKILIIGFGSIGAKHARILSKFKNISEIAVKTKSKIIKIKKTFVIKNLEKFNPDYIIISSKTSEHYSNVREVEKYYKKKVVLIEKPVFESYKKIGKLRNKYFVGYNLRLHPVIGYLKKISKKHKFFSIDIYCSSFLPNWRKKRNYSKTYSSIKKYGGGALLDLSHELDYLQWLFGKISEVYFFYRKKLSNLKLNVEDNYKLTGRIKKIFFSLNVNFFSKLNFRKIILNGNNISIEADLLKNTIFIVSKKKIKKIKFNKNKDYTYIKEHKLILNKKFNYISNIEDGLNILKLIDNLKKIK